MKSLIRIPFLLAAIAAAPAWAQPDYQVVSVTVPVTLSKIPAVVKSFKVRCLTNTAGVKDAESIPFPIQNGSANVQVKLPLLVPVGVPPQTLSNLTSTCRVWLIDAQNTENTMGNSTIWWSGLSSGNASVTFAVH